MNRALDLVIASDQRINESLCGLINEIDRKGFQGIDSTPRRAFLPLFLVFVRLRFRLFVGGDLGNAVRNIVHQIEARDALLLQQEDRIGVWFAEHGDQHIAAVDLFALRRLCVNHRALQDAMKAQCLLRLLFPALGQRFHLAGEVFFERSGEPLEVAAARKDRSFAVLIAQQGKKQVFQAHILMAPSLGFFQGEI